MTGFWRITEDGVAVAVKVQPKARRSGCGGVAPSSDGPRLRIAVHEPAEDGRATRAACAVLAEALAVPAGAVSLAMGAVSREKLLRVAGDPDALSARLAKL